jgi:pyridoxamine 5'-phosphate oxidase
MDAMSTSTPQIWTEVLPEPLPPDPLVALSQWLAQARQDAAQPNPNSMVLATVDAAGQPSARVVLCKDIDPHAGCITFYTNYLSRKGHELDGNPRVAIVFHWDHRHRQVRAEGHVERLPEADSDEYFQGRAWQSRLGAWASRQSEPVKSKDVLKEAMAGAARRFGIPWAGPGSPEPKAVSQIIARPAYWGGYRIVVNAIELWVEGEYRIHDRARWIRSSAAGPGAADRWSVTRLQP